MAKPGRQSSAALSVASSGFAAAPEPPNHLNKKESGVWREIVGTKPNDWFSEENLPLLEAYCQHVILYRTVGKRLQKLRATHLDSSDDIDMYDKLLKMSDREAKLLSSLATKMRLTQQSRYTTKAAGTANQSSGRKKPWAS